MTNEKDMSSIFAAMNKIIDNTDLTNVTSESEGFEELPDGFFLSEVVSAELTTSKKSGLPMAAFRLKTVEDGYDIIIDAKGKQSLKKLNKTKGQYQGIYYVFKEERDIKRFAKDMLKFEDTPDVPLIDKEIFEQAELIAEALPLLVGRRLYTQVSTSTDDEGNNATKWTNFISWKRAKQFELPVE